MLFILGISDFHRKASSLYGHPRQGNVPASYSVFLSGCQLFLSSHNAVVKVVFSGRAPSWSFVTPDAPQYVTAYVREAIVFLFRGLLDFFLSQ